jgi:hypothetical protein
MSGKWIPWKSNLISSWEVKTDQASFNAIRFPLPTQYLSSFSEPPQSLCSPVSLPSQGSWARGRPATIPDEKRKWLSRSWLP